MNDRHQYESTNRHDIVVSVAAEYSNVTSLHFAHSYIENMGLQSNF